MVLPTYNGATYLAQSIESVLAQTHTALELLIVDDCSTDSTPAIIDRYAAQDSRLRPLRHTVNKKLPGALNTGFAAAQGDFFTWTSDDNLYRPAALATLLAALQAQPAAGVVYADYTLIDGQGRPLRRVRVAPPAAIVYKAVVGACFLYRRELHVALNGYDETLFLAEDYDFWLRAALRGPLLPLPEDLYLYRMHEGSLTEQKRQQVLARREAVLLRHVPRFQHARPHDLALAYMHLAGLARARGDAAAARARWRTAAGYAPWLTGRRWLKETLLPPPLRAALEGVYARLRGPGTP